MRARAGVYRDQLPWCALIYGAAASLRMAAAAGDRTRSLDEAPIQPRVVHLIEQIGAAMAMHGMKPGDLIHLVTQVL